MRPKRKFLSAILVLLCVSTIAVTAESVDNQGLSIAFNAKAKGPGAVIWGIAGIPAVYPPSLVYGEYDYHAVLTKSKFDLKGKLTEVTYDNRSAIEEVWWFRDAKGNGKLHAKWDDHEFKIKIAMDSDAFGGYRIYDRYPHLVAGINEYAGSDTLELFDPQLASITFKGKYDGDKISGRLNTLLGDMGFIVNLWIEGLNAYLCFLWLEEGDSFPIEEPCEDCAVITIPVVKKLRFKVKFQSTEE